MMPVIGNSRNVGLITIIAGLVLLCIIIGQQLTVSLLPNSALAEIVSNNTQLSKSSGDIRSVQFSGNEDPKWIISGPWKMLAGFDRTGMIPTSVKSFNATLNRLSADGVDIKRYKLLNFVQDSISYDNNTNTSSIKGKLSVQFKNTLDNVGADIKLTNKKILMISLDPSKVKDHFGETPLYGVIWIYGRVTG